MNLFEQIKTDQLKARKDKAPISSKLLTTLIGEVTRNGAKSDTSDVTVTAIIKKFIKGIDETLSHTVDDYTQHILKIEKMLLNEYLPKQMSKDELVIAINSLFERGETMNKGNMMKRLKEKYAGQYDGKTASEAVDEILKG